MPELPAIPAGKTGSSVPMRTPTAPAASALFQRSALPHARVASSSSHQSQTIVPAIWSANGRSGFVSSTVQPSTSAPW